MSAIPKTPGPAEAGFPDASIDPAAVVRAAGRGDFLVEIVETTGSTQADLVARARLLARPVPVLRAALHQESGRGRMGRSWHDDPGGSLLFSLSIPWPLSPAASPAVTLACGCALAEAIEGVLVPAATRNVPRLALKWPNDVLLDGAKLAGILVELVGDGSGAGTLVIGVGCNLALGPQARARVGQAAADLAQATGKEAALALRERLLGTLAAGLLSACERFASAGFAAFHERYIARLAWRGERVRLLGEDRATRNGTLLGIDSHGRLMLGTPGGIEAVSGGELRRENMR